MRSSRGSEPAAPAAIDVPFRLRELTTCWDQAYEALVRADLERTAGLLHLADEHLQGLPAPGHDDAATARLRELAMAAHGRLAAAMTAGLDAIAGELGRVRQGQKALHGYADPSLGLGNRVESRA